MEKRCLLKSKDDHAVPNAKKTALAKIGLMTKEVKLDLGGDSYARMNTLIHLRVLFTKTIDRLKRSRHI